MKRNPARWFVEAGEILMVTIIFQNVLPKTRGAGRFCGDTNNLITG
jgi:hypothetical protein